jgi:hypothetical protein
VVLRFDVLLAGEPAADQLDAVLGQMREIGNGFFLDFAVFAVRMHEQMGHVLAVLPLPAGRHHVNGAAGMPFSCHKNILPHNDLFSKYIY